MRETERQGEHADRGTEGQRDRETERQRDRETERQRDRETGRQSEVGYHKIIRQVAMSHCLAVQKKTISTSTPYLL